jgi:hypothetical protein
VIFEEFVPDFDRIPAPEIELPEHDSIPLIVRRGLYKIDKNNDIIGSILNHTVWQLSDLLINPQIIVQKSTEIGIERLQIANMKSIAFSINPFSYVMAEENNKQPNCVQKKLQGSSKFPAEKLKRVIIMKQDPIMKFDVDVKNLYKTSDDKLGQNKLSKNKFSISLKNLLFEEEKCSNPEKKSRRKK